MAKILLDSIIRFSLLFLFFFHVEQNFAQSITMERTIEFVNLKLDGKYKIDVKKGILQLDCFEKGNLVRHDEIELIHINVENITYLDAEKQVVLKCKFDQAECIGREIYTVRKKTQVSRSAIELAEDSKAGASLTKAFKHMVMLIQYRKYKSEEWFE